MYNILNVNVIQHINIIKTSWSTTRWVITESSYNLHFMYCLLLWRHGVVDSTSAARVRFPAMTLRSTQPSIISRSINGYQDAVVSGLNWPGKGVASSLPSGSNKMKEEPSGRLRLRPNYLLTYPNLFISFTYLNSL